MYDFDQIIDRRQSNSMKWNVKENELPMWVADMDFATAPAVREAVETRAAHGLFGYSELPEEWYEAYQYWWKKRYDFEIRKEWLVFSTGVLPSISSAVRKLTTPAEKIVVQTPVYNMFFNSIVNNGRNILESPLVFDGEEYSIDYADLEEKLSDPQTTMMILCNPHNPVGKIWSREELAKIGELCAKYNVIVISDEIHCDLTTPGYTYTPFAKASETCKNISITCVAPSKTFNIAGLNTSAVFAADPLLRQRIWRALNTDEVAEPNAFAVQAAVAAYTKSEEWVEELRNYVYGNKQYVKQFLEKEIPEIKFVDGDATYLCWMNVEKITKDSADLQQFIREKTGLYLTDGGHYGKSGEGFFRLNVACPRAVVEEGLHRLKTGIELYK